MCGGDRLPQRFGIGGFHRGFGGQHAVQGDEFYTWGDPFNMRGHFAQNLFGGLGLHQADIAFDHSFMGQHGLGSGTAITAVESVDRKSRVEHQAVVERAGPGAGRAGRDPSRL